MSTSQPSEAGRRESPDPASHAMNVYDAPGTEAGSLDQIDDEMEIDLTAAESELENFLDSSDDSGVDYYDAEDDLNGVEVEISMESDTNDGADEDGAGASETHTQPVAATGAIPTRIQVPLHLVQLIGAANLRQFLRDFRDEPSGTTETITSPTDEDNRVLNGYRNFGTQDRRRPGGGKAAFAPVPSPEGRALMSSGDFGANEDFRDRTRNRKTTLVRKLMSRELGNDPSPAATAPRTIAQGMIPSSNADMIVHYNSRCYSGQFSDDGNFFFSCAQDFKVRMYDTSNPYLWKYYKTVIYPYGQWTITDASLSPDNKHLAYSSIRSVVCLAPTDPNEDREPSMLDFSNLGTGRTLPARGVNGFSHFGIWSLRFSGDGREIVAGTSDHSVYVYDIEAQRSILKIHGHREDVNAVCFGDTTSPHILYSGSDDSLIKVWDRRSMRDRREAGVFMGHTEGVTYVDSKGDGRYVLSNGKDQTMKLWDIRKMMSTEESAKLDPGRYTTAFDYRFMTYDAEDYLPHPHDCSVVTFRGHSVLKTLIRCHFSPPNSTNSRYVYTGSEDGSVYIYNIDATLAGKVDVTKATHNSRPRDPNAGSDSYFDDRRDRKVWKTCVRDASWHPDAPVIAATSWNGWGMSTGTCTTHSWNDGAEDDEGWPPMGRRVDQHLNRDDSLYDDAKPRRARASQRRPRMRSQRVPAPAVGDDDGEEEFA